MSVDWRRTLEDGTQVCRLNDGSFVFLRDFFVKGNYYAFLKLEHCEVHPLDKCGPHLPEIEIIEFNALDQSSTHGYIMDNHDISMLDKELKHFFKLTVPEYILDDLDAVRLARRFNNGQRPL